MGKCHKNIAVVFLLLAGVIIIAHSIIQHDHHPEFPGFGNESSCHAGKDKTGHHDSFPLHCHAFNDLTCEKFTFTVTENHAGISCFLFTPASESVAGVLTSNPLRFPVSGEPLVTADFPESSPFRAPPAIV